MANDGIGLVFKSAEVASQQPGLLQEFKLPFDVSVQAHEKQPGFAAAVVFAIVCAADAQYPMPVGDANLHLRSRRKTIPGVGTAHVRPEWAAQAVWIFRAEQEVIVPRVGATARSTRRGRMPHQ